MYMYKHGAAFAADIKRQIKSVRSTVQARQRHDGEPELGPTVQEYRERPVRDALGQPILQGEPAKPLMELYTVPVPAFIKPREYHRLGGVR